MAKPAKTGKTNAERGLERHVNPADPQGPMLKCLPTLAVIKAHAEVSTELERREPQEKRTKKKSAKKR